MSLLHVFDRRSSFAVAVSLVVASAYVQPYRPMVFVGNSMTPTYKTGSLVLTAQLTSPPKRGDVVVVNTSSGPIVKRVAYLGGDLIPELYHGGVWMYAGDFGKPHRFAPSLKIRHRMVPLGEVFVLGDNSATSEDSRQLGTFPLSAVERVVVRSRPKAPSQYETLYPNTGLPTTW